MPDSPISASPYDVLGVPATASDEELRRAYRRMLRETHPDTGGSATAFDEVQRAWQRIGTSDARESYDQGRSTGTRESNDVPWATQPPHRPRDSRPLARSHGHPGGWRREQYLRLIREWVGRGVTVSDPYDEALVRSAPRDIRHVLADALAEEATARALSQLGIAYTIWHDVATDAAANPERKLDHVVLGPTGLFALLSEDWGSAVGIRKGELVSDGFAPGEEPLHELSQRARSVARAARVKFTALGVIVPDGATEQGLILPGRMRGVPTVLVQHSRLPELMRTGLASAAPMGGNELFDVRTRLQSTVRFV